jgi:hypothetical protein
MRRGRSVYEQPGTRVDGIAPRKEEGFQVSKRDSGERGNWQRGTSKGNKEGLRHDLVLLILVCVS